ncbi:hypothetical protein NDU88_002023 [Pleurodeles waltl]|uniref:Uncharacterized protein n=1 Tax=Pleurodeles waltl TaxID=8319 RepID=A0AAV7LD48_PLEWA|nr:hypothetical protein NDU88_002023 [Pleurodeles waltl]
MDVRVDSLGVPAARRSRPTSPPQLPQCRGRVPHFPRSLGAQAQQRVQQPTWRGLRSAPAPALLTTGTARPPRFPCMGCHLWLYMLRCDFLPRMRRRSAAIRTPRALGGLAPSV